MTSCTLRVSEKIYKKSLLDQKKFSIMTLKILYNEQKFVKYHIIKVIITNKGLL